ncbi:MAG: VanW family protein [Lachnospiraceae bacterium]|nr:VanW family protein [Lachnospiraceae bacterium]
MKKIRKRIVVVVLSLLLAVVSAVALNPAKAVAVSGDDVILEGVYMGDINLAGMTADEAKAVVNSFVEELKQKSITFGAVGDHYVSVMAGDLGLNWVNEADIDAAAALGKKGNIVKRYKAIEDLKHGNKVYDLKLSLDRDLIKNVLEEQCTEYDIAPVNNTITRVDGQFVIEEGQTGQRVNVEESLNKAYDYITNGWDYQDASIDLAIDVSEPQGSIEDLQKMTDVLGTFTTSYSTSSASRCKNVENGCRLINGTLLYPGDEFSTYDTIKPFTEANGYYPAGSYVNGKVVDSLGGGICQVSTTLYNAVLLAELEVTERNNHSMIITYVEPSMDAAIAESSGKDFRFVNNLNNPIYIEGHTEGKQITFTIFGVEQRDPGHVVRYESETLSTIHPDHDVITPTTSQGVGYISVESAHIGYTAQLWKVVEENGVEVSREVINKSSYKVSPRSAVVGVNTDNPVYASRINAAVASGSIDTCKAEAAAIKAEMSAAATQPDAAAQQQADLEAYYQALQQQQLLEQQQQLLEQQQQLEQQAPAEQPAPAE